MVTSLAMLKEFSQRAWPDKFRENGELGLQIQFSILAKFVIRPGLEEFAQRAWPGQI